MTRRLIDSTVDLVWVILTEPAVSVVEAREHARALAMRDRLDDVEARRLMRVADALLGPAPPEEDQ